MNAPRLMFRYLGKRNAKSLEVAMELVEMLVPRVARPLLVSALHFRSRVTQDERKSSKGRRRGGRRKTYKAVAQKKAPALLSHLLIIWVGSQ
jgi:hypothetical protein